MDDLISRQWLMGCVNEGWIKFDTAKDENRFIHLVRDIASSAQPEERTNKCTETHACDCISREAAIDALGERPMVWVGSDYELGARNQYDADVLALETVPSAQPEIIACGDCKHWICHDRRCGFWNHGVKPLDWCCHAERRTDERSD